MFNIKTEKDLTLFLKIVAQEAVKETKFLLEEKGINDPFVNSFQERLNQDGLLEQENEEEEESPENTESEDAVFLKTGRPSIFTSSSDEVFLR